MMKGGEFYSLKSWTPDDCMDAFSCYNLYILMLFLGCHHYIIDLYMVAHCPSSMCFWAVENMIAILDLSLVKERYFTLFFP